MIQKIAVVCLAISSMLPSTFGQSAKQNPQTSQRSQTGQNAQENAQGPKVVQIAKIDARKMTLFVKDDVPESSSTAQPATGSARRRSSRPRSNPGANHNQGKQYKVYLTNDTVFKDGETIISFSRLKAGDYIVVTGSPKGSDVQATQVVRNSK